MNLDRTLQLAGPFNTLGRRLGVAFPVLCLAAALILGTAVSNESRAATIPVPNGSFESVYKPGSTTITADLGGNWTNGVGPGTPMNGTQTAAYSDGTTGTSVDVPGWINTPGWPPSYAWPVGCGSIAGQSTSPDGVYYYTANGGAWGNAQGASIESDAPLTTVGSGLDYTVSMLANGPVIPIFLELLADGVPLTPSSSVDPAAPHAWDVISRTYDAASLSLAGHLGKSLRIRVGWGPDAVNSQSQLDNVTLDAIPEPATLSLLALGGLAMLRRRRR